MNATESGISQITLALLLVGLMTPVSFGQESPTQGWPPRDQPATLGPGDHACALWMGKRKRTYNVHVPMSYDPKKPAPVVLALHGSAMNGWMMVRFSGLNKTSDAAGFIAVYPDGTGIGPFLDWNAGELQGEAHGRPDDVAFIGILLNNLGAMINMDEQRVYACGMSDGGMMCYRLAAELSDRIAAIAPVAGTIAIEESKPNRAVSVIHFHGLKDHVVPYDAPNGNKHDFPKPKRVEDSIQTWVRLNGCEKQPRTDTLSETWDKIKVTRKTFGGGRDESEVVLIAIEEGGHTWPGQQPPLGIGGKSVKSISANDLMWEFFQKHPMNSGQGVASHRPSAAH